MLWLIPTVLTLLWVYLAQRDSRDARGVSVLIWVLYSAPMLLGWLVYLVICAVS